MASIFSRGATRARAAALDGGGEAPPDQGEDAVAALNADRPPPPAPTIFWNVDADGDWATAADWSLGRLPGAADNVSINTTHLHTVTHSSGTDTAHTLAVGRDKFAVSGGSLTITSTSSFANGVDVSGGILSLGGPATATTLAQSSGTLSGTGTLTASGGASFSGLFVQQTGSGTTVLQGTSALSVVNSGYGLELDGARVLENQGVFNLVQGDIRLGYNRYGSLGGGSIINDAGATFDIQGAGSIYAVKGATGITNAGTFEQTVKTATTHITPSFTNTGTVSTQSGTLEFDAGFTNSGAGIALVGAGATLNLAGGGSAAASAVSIASTGTLDFGAGAFALGTGTVGGAGTIELAGGALAVSGGVGVGALAQSSGTLSGTGTLTASGGASFSGLFVQQTGSGTTVLQGTSALSVVNSGYGLELDGARVLENQGVFNLVQGDIRLGYNRYGSLGGGSIINDAGATFDIQGAGSIYAVKGATGITNAGTFEQTVKTATTHITPSFTNTGTVSTQSGTLEFDGGFTNSGAGIALVGAGATLNLAGGGSAAASAVSIASTGTLDFGAGAFALGTGTVGGAGTIELAGGALAVSGGVGVGALAQSSGTLSGTGTLTASGGASFSGLFVQQTGSGTTVLQGTSALSVVNSGYGLELDGARVLENQGVFNLVQGDIRLGYNRYGSLGGGSIINDAGATFDIQGAGSIYAVKGTTGITNAGTFEQTVKTATTHITPSFTNTGTVSAQTGTLEFDGGFTNSGTVETTGQGGSRSPAQSAILARCLPTRAR